MRPAASEVSPDSSNAGLADQCIILRMASYPEPENAIGGVDAESAIVQADADGMKAANLLEVE
jgi:hypothetical protein